jgi:hypothetical protein
VANAVEHRVRISGLLSEGGWRRRERRR